MNLRKPLSLITGFAILGFFIGNPEVLHALTLDQRQWFQGGSDYVDRFAVEPEEEEQAQGTGETPYASGDVCETNLVGNDAAQQVFNFFTSPPRNLTPEQAAGIVGNLAHESAGTFDPTIREFGNNGEGQGLAQWSYGRRQNLYDWAELNGLNFNSIGVQLEYLWAELQGTGPLEGREGAAYRDLLNARTVEDATFSFMDKFERPNFEKRGFDSRLRFAFDLTRDYIDSPLLTDIGDCKGGGDA